MPVRLAITIAMAIAAALAAGSAAPAAASSLAVEAGVLVYTADAGEANATDMLLGPAPNSVYVYTLDEVSFGAGCAPTPDVGLVYFGVAYLCHDVTGGARIDVGDEGDWVTAEMPGQMPVIVDAGDGDDFVGMYDGDDVVAAGAGNDEIYGGHGDDRLDGGDGNDQINGDYGGFSDGEQVREDLQGAGADMIDGGAGDDRLQGNGGADVLNGGAGDDTALFNARQEAVAVSLDGQANDGQAGEKDNVGLDVEGVITGLGDDVVHGGGATQTITTGAGDDTVDPGAGVDTVDTGTGADTIAARDGATDKLGCGDGADTATVDAEDVTGSDCEQLDRPAGAPAAAALPARLTPLGLALRRVGRATAGRRLRLAGRVSLPAAAEFGLCAGAAVRLQFTETSGRKRRRGTALAVLGADCGFSVVLPGTLRRGSRVVVRARLEGTRFLAPVGSRRLTVRVRR